MCRRVTLTASLQSSSLGSFLWFSSAPPADDVLNTGSEEEIRRLIGANDVVIFSKTYCPFCHRVKDLFERTLELEAKVYELDELPAGGAAQSSLAKISGQSSVPNVFIGGEHVGGCDDTFALFENGTLLQNLER